MPTTKPDLSALADAVERAWEKMDLARDDWKIVKTVLASVQDYLAARRAALDAGYVEALVSKEAVEALRLRLLPWGSHHPCCEKPEGQCTCGEEALARDLAALLKETP